MKEFSRKSFLKKIGASSAGFLGIPFLNTKKETKNVEVLESKVEQKKYSANDQLNLGVIGAGIRGQQDVEGALEVNGVKLVAACDLYDDRLERCKERWGKDLFTTRDYRELLDRNEVDAVIVATPDHWHDTITIDALEAEKDVYCEKPMVEDIKEGLAMIEAEKNNDALLQIGSQSTSRILNAKARELFNEGVIGELNYVEASWSRQSYMGAWNYPIPESAGPKNIDWDTFLKDLPDEPFSAEKFFRWRKYRNFGSGVAGDLFVHRFSALHFIIGSKGPERLYGTGGIRYWDDGRNVPDVMLATFDYPETENHPAFNLSLRVNFASGSDGGSTKLVGTDGEMILDGGRLIVRRRPMPEEPRWLTLENYSKKVQKELELRNKEKNRDQSTPIYEERVFETGDGLGGTALHHKTLFDAMRNEENSIVQDGTFGLRAAGPALAANVSYFEDRPVDWDAENMRIV